jgi:hypothetical protein
MELYKMRGPQCRVVPSDVTYDPNSAPEMGTPRATASFLILPNKHRIDMPFVGIACAFGGNSGQPETALATEAHG